MYIDYCSGSFNFNGFLLLCRDYPEETEHCPLTSLTLHGYVRINLIHGAICINIDQPRIRGGYENKL